MQIRIIIALILCFSVLSKANSQTNFESRWEDFFSYNEVRDITVQNNLLYALTENAVFSYNLETSKLDKISTVNGLSGEITSSIFYHANTERLVIGYQNGLLEIVEPDGTVRVSSDIVNFSQSGEKSINHIAANNNTLYISLPFGVVEYDISRLEFGDTFFIGDNSQEVNVNQIVIDDNNIYAATTEGLFRASLDNNNLIDFNNWTLVFGGNYEHLLEFNNQIYLSQNRNLFRLEADSNVLIRSFSNRINDMFSNDGRLLVSENKKVTVLDSSLNNLITINATSDFDFTLNKSVIVGSTIYLATNEFGVLESSSTNPTSFVEIHPEGPLKNDIFSIKAQDNHLWVVFGGYNNTYAPLNTNAGYSFFDGEKWNNTRFDSSNPLPDLVDVTFDPQNVNKVYISSFGSTADENSRKTGGLLVVEDGQETEFYNQLNSPLEDILPDNPGTITIRLTGSVFDNRGDLWVTNVGVPGKLKKFSNGSWSSYSFGSLATGFGMTEIKVDRGNNIWVGTRSGGAIVFNENGARLRALTTSATQGSLPNGNVRSIDIDDNNRIWIGTSAGLVVFNNANNVFNADNVDAEPVVFLENGVPRRLLGDQTVNSIVVDGANNKWFGTDNGGVIYTNPNGQRTLATFNKSNSPLPSNKIVKIAVDETTGKVFFATDRGVVAYDSNVSPFGNELGEVYAYPNPVLKNHQNVTIDGRNGTNLPRGTNVKILDVAGNLVFETNVIEGQQLNGGKIIWNKRNLAGKLVSSGIYIVLLSNDDASETSTTKIAIIN